MAVVADSGFVAAGMVCLVVLAFAAVGGPPAGGPPPDEVGDGTASLSVVSPTTDALATSPGRFGTSARYLRLPDLVVDVSGVDGRPRVVYRVVVPALDVDRQVHEVVTSPGRVRLEMADRAYPPAGYPGGFRSLPGDGTYEGRLVVRVQSFTTDRTVLNRSVSVRVRG